MTSVRWIQELDNQMKTQTEKFALEKVIYKSEIIRLLHVIFMLNVKFQLEASRGGPGGPGPPDHQK